MEETLHPDSRPIPIMSEGKLHPEYSSICEWMANTIHDCVTYGEEVLGWTEETPVGGYGDATVKGLLRHFLETTDGLAVLVRQGCADAAKPLLRSAFECSLSLEYILEKNSLPRALAYQAAHARRRIKVYRNLNPRTSDGQEFRKKIPSDPLAPSILRMDPEKLDEREANLVRMLSRPEFVQIDLEWQATKR